MTAMSSLPNPALSRAVLIGTSDFERVDRLPSLPAVDNNLIDLRRALTDPICGILTRRNCPFVDSPDSPASFLEQLRRAANQAEDLLLVYYAGHGLRHPTKDLLYLAVRQTNPDLLSSSAVCFDDVRETIEDSPARTRLLILDCCYSGVAIGAMSDGAVSPRDIEVSGTSVITSSPRNEISFSPPEDQHTAFTGELISLLTNGSHLVDEPLTVRVLYACLRAALANRQLPLPQMNSRNTSGDLLLRRAPLSAPVFVPPAEPALTSSPPDPPNVTEGAAAPTPSLSVTDIIATTGIASIASADPIPAVEIRRTQRHLLGWFTVGFGWLLVWIGLAFGIDFGVGGLVGALFARLPNGQPSDDLGLGIGMSVVAVVCGLALWLHRMRLKAAGHPWPPLHETNPKLALWLGKLRTPVLVVALLFCLIGTPAMLVNSPQQTTTTGPNSDNLSNVASSVSGALFFGQGALVCGYWLVRRYRSAEPPQ